MKPKLLLVGALVAVLAVSGMAGVGAGSSSDPRPVGGRKAQQPPDLLLLDGKITTVDRARPFARAVAIRDGEIVAVGPNHRIRRLARHGTHIIDLNGRRVLPGLIDGTLHGLRNGYHCFSRAVRLDVTFSRDAALDAYAARGAELPADTWIFTTAGWSVNQLDVPGMFTKEELDAALPNHPVLVEAFGANPQVNSRALELLGIDASTPDPPGGQIVRDPVTGEPTGELIGTAVNPARQAIGRQLNELSIDEQAACLEEFIHEANRFGLTAWDDPGGNDPFDPQGRLIEFARGGHGFQAVNQLHREGRLDARVVMQMTSFGGLETVRRDTRHALSMVGDDKLRLGGPGEEVMPGGFFAQPVRPPQEWLDEYAQVTLHLARNRWRFEHHSDTAENQDAILDLWEAADAVAPIADLHWALLHPKEMSRDILARLRALGAGVVPTDEHVRGEEDHPPYRRMYRSGTRMCLGTDAMNVAPFPPFVNLWYVVSGDTYDPAVPGVPRGQRLTRMQALRSATINCAWFVLQDDRVGSIEVGKHADLIVLSDDYFEVPKDEIRDITSVLTIVNGEIVFADAEFAGLEERRR